MCKLTRKERTTKVKENTVQEGKMQQLITSSSDKNESKERDEVGSLDITE